MVFRVSKTVAKRLQSIKCSSSPLWSEILSCKEFLVSGFRVRIGNGLMASFWKDRWCGDFTLQFMLPSLL
ncbi:hypothetical protein Taro_007559 [Colocasia esculenta]|uniref:Uncharacterized protein n=1 Tax=Colocasia esculenta TaxID=4460 RepID=A0A843TYJ8_COLES|nr:hypothetical protein [Colocasia esculenta]